MASTQLFSILTIANPLKLCGREVVLPTHPSRIHGFRKNLSSHKKFKCTDCGRWTRVAGVFPVSTANLFAEVDTAEDGQEALNKMDERDYDIVLTDLSMPRMSGLRLVDHIRKKSHLQIVIAISAHDDEEFAEALAPYNVKLLTKPLEMDELFETLVPLCEQLC